MTDVTESPGKTDDRLSFALEWDCGTAYDMLFSLHTIFRPKRHGVPAPWAAGVRKRLSPQAQVDLKAFFNQNFSYIAYTPLHLILEMEQPKDGRHLLEYVEAIPDEDFSRRIHLPIPNKHITRVIEKATSGAKMVAEDVEQYRRAIAQIRVASAPSVAEVRRLFAEMSDPAGTKKRWLSVLREYYTLFFAAEEKREGPVLQRMLEDAQKLSREMSVPDMMEQLSNGFTLSEDIDLKRLVLVPSVWLHPFVVRFDISDRELFVAWGAHPPGYKLVPGESVPEEAMLVLRALGDPTRLRLLRLIANEPRSLQSLAKEVKLSLPTVSHHVRELRVAGLIRLEEGGRGRETKYTVRWQSAQQAFTQLEDFVTSDGADEVKAQSPASAGV